MSLNYLLRTLDRDDDISSGNVWKLSQPRTNLSSATRTVRSANSQVVVVVVVVTLSLFERTTTQFK